MDRRKIIYMDDVIEAVEKNACNTQRIMDAVNNLPPAKPEPKEGHWKKDETDDCPPVFRQFRICSVCGAIETSETNYCPNCGAKMTNK